MGNGEKMFAFPGLSVHAAVRGGTCASTLKIVNTLINSSSSDDRPSISTYLVESTHGQPGSCWARSVGVDNGLKDIRWIRGLSVRELARDVLRSSLKTEKRSIFLPSEMDREFSSPVFYTAAPKYVCIRRLAGARHVSPVVLRTL